MTTINLSNDIKIINSNNPVANIIFIHGFTSSNVLHSEFEKNIDKNYNYYSFNLPGHNENKMGQFKSDEFDFNNYINYVISYIHTNKLNNIILIGHSMGGGIALFVYNKIKHLIKKIILVAPINSCIYKSKVGLQYLNYVFKKDIKGLKKLIIKNEKNINSDLLEYLNFELNKLFTYKFRYLLLGTKLLSPLLLNNLKNLYKNIDAETLIILGTKDNIIPYENTLKMLHAINNKNINIKIINDVGHLIFVENFNKYNELIWNFIKKDNYVK